jgi:hypothetical protein
MEITTRQIAGERPFIWVVILLGAVFCGLTGFLIGSDPIATCVMLFSVVLTIVWTLNAGKRWWLLMPIAGALGGYFYFGFKLYPHEVALAGCLAPLVIARSMQARNLVEREHAPFPRAMFFLSIYLFAHWIGSCIYNRLEGDGGYGNVTRAYLNALWVIIFLFAFRRYGSSKFIPAALLGIYLASAARVAMGIFFALTNGFAYIPVINYVLPGSTNSRFADLRFSGMMAASVAICYFLMKRGLVRRLFHGLIFVASLIALLFGSGRGNLVLTLLSLTFAAAISRKVVPLIGSTIAILAVIVLLNLRPHVLDPLPFAVQRSASILLLDKSLSARYGLAESSDEWHERLRELGFQKWTRSWNTFLFGTGIRPYDNAIREAIPGQTTTEDFLESSSKVGAYESGWWTTIAVTGLVGLLLYLSVMFFLLKRLVPVLIRERVRDHRHAFALLGVLNISIWLALGWASGGFPSTEIMFGFLAVFALDDARKRARHITSVPRKEFAPLALRA